MDDDTFDASESRSTRDFEEKSSLARKLEHLQQQFRAHLPARIDAIVAAIHRIQGTEQDPGAQAAARLAGDGLHNLIGAASTYGYREVGRTAEAMARLLRRQALETAPSDSIEWRELRFLADHLTTLRDQPPDQMLISVLPPEAPPQTRHIHIVDDDPQQTALIAHWLTEAGYRTETFHSIAVYADLFPGLTRPDAIIMDMRFDGATYAGAEYLKRLKRHWTHAIPILFVSVMDTLEARLRALRAGAARYLTKPVERETLLRLLEPFSNPDSDTPLRVLLVDDDVDLLAAAAASLRVAGLEVREIASPLDAFDGLDGFRPDVIVLDVMMPDVSGPELASIIREKEAFQFTPMVFISGEIQHWRELEAASLLTELFLIKPVPPQQLTLTVQALGHKARRRARLQSART